MIGIIIAALVSLIAGTAGGYLISQNVVKGKSKRIVKEAEEEAELIKKERILQAKEKFLQLKTEHEKTVNDKQREISAAAG